MLKSNTNIATVKRILNDFFLFILFSVKKVKKNTKIYAKTPLIA